MVLYVPALEAELPLVDASLPLEVGALGSASPLLQPKTVKKVIHDGTPRTLRESASKFLMGVTWRPIAGDGSCHRGSCAVSNRTRHLTVTDWSRFLDSLITYLATRNFIRWRTATTESTTSARGVAAESICCLARAGVANDVGVSLEIFSVTIW